MGFFRCSNTFSYFFELDISPGILKEKIEEKKYIFPLVGLEPAKVLYIQGRNRKWKQVKVFWLARIGRNFDGHPGFQLFFTQGKHFCHECSFHINHWSLFSLLYLIDHTPGVYGRKCGCLVAWSNGLSLLSPAFRSCCCDSRCVSWIQWTKKVPKNSLAAII